MVRHARDYVVGEGRWSKVLGGIHTYEAYVWADLWFAEYAVQDKLRAVRP
jgi:hypothetical protein